MAFPTWRFVLSTLSGETLGEVLDATERTCTPTLQAPSTATFKVLATNPLLDELFGRGDLNLRCYRNGQILFHGPILSTNLAAENDTGTPTVQCVAADPAWRFTKRVIDRTAAGTTQTQNRLTLAETAIASANSDGETGIQTMGYTISGSTVYTYGPYRKLNEIVDELANTVGGFDWRVKPIEYASGKIGQFHAGDVPTPLSSSRMGGIKPGVVFQYQGRGNMRVPNFMVTMDGIANRVYSIPDDGPASPLTVLSKDSPTSIAKRGLYQDIADTANIGETSLRNSVLDAHIAFRRNPRQVLTFQPEIQDGSGRVPEYGQDYDLGDYVRAVVVYNEATLIDGFVRIYKMDFTIDDNSKESMTPTLVQEETA